MEIVIGYCEIRTEFMYCVQINVFLWRLKVLLHYVAP